MGLDAYLGDKLSANTAAVRDLEKKLEVLTSAMEFNSILKLYELGLITEEELKTQSHTRNSKIRIIQKKDFLNKIFF